MENFYYLHEQEKRSEVRIKPIEEYDDVKLCNGEYSPSKPIKCIVDSGKKYYDIIRFQDVYNFAISQKAYDILNENNITGWKSYDIDIQGQQNKYYGVQITGRSGVLIEPEKEGWYTGYNFEHSSWDGNDLFLPKDTLLIFCTPKVKEIFKKNKITNYELSDISKEEYFSLGK